MQNYKLNGVKSKMSFLTAGIAFMVALCHATEFPSAGGDIASNSMV
jgi:hypothetical protein